MTKWLGVHQRPNSILAGSSDLSGWDALPVRWMDSTRDTIIPDYHFLNGYFRAATLRERWTLLRGSRNAGQTPTPYSGKPQLRVHQWARGRLPTARRMPSCPTARIVVV